MWVYGAVCVLGRVVVSPRWKALVAGLGLAPVLVGLAGRPDPKLQHKALLVLRALACLEEAKDAIMAAGGVPAFVAFLTASNEKLKEDAVGALRNLSHRCEEHHGLVVDATALPGLIALLSSTNTRILEGVVNALQNMSHSNGKRLVVSL